MLQSDPSSYESQQSASGLWETAVLAKLAYAFSSIVQGPDGAVEVDLIAERVGKGRSLGDGRGNGGLEEIHGKSQLRFLQSVFKTLREREDNVNTSVEEDRRSYSALRLSSCGGASFIIRIVELTNAAVSCKEHRDPAADTQPDRYLLSLTSIHIVLWASAYLQTSRITTYGASVPVCLHFTMDHSLVRQSDTPQRPVSFAVTDHAP